VAALSGSKDRLCSDGVDHLGPNYRELVLIV